MSAQHPASSIQYPAIDHGPKGKDRLFLSTAAIILFLIMASLFSACVIPGLTRVFTEDRSSVKTASPDPFVQKGVKRLTPRPLPVNRPEQVTFESDPVLYAALSGDGRKLVYTTAESGPSSLWLRTLDPSIVELPERLVQGVGRITAPAISPDGRKIAFTATGHDAKGDIHLVTLGTDNRSPKRLTGRETQDGAPAFSPDGATLYFHRSRPGQTGRHLATLDLRRESSTVQPLDTGGDGAFPAISPDARQCAFVSGRNDPGGDIFVLHLPTGRVTPVTQGPALDLYPSWSPDGRHIYFSRFASDTTGDGRITPEDHAVICRVDGSAPDPLVYPLTSEAFSAFQPLVTSSGLSFLSSLRGAGNLWRLPPEGMIPLQQDAKAQIDLARTLADRRPGDDRLSVMAFYKVLEGFPDQYAASAQAAYEMGNVYQRMGRPGDADRTYSLVVASFSEAVPEASLARIRLEGIRAPKAWKTATTDAAKQAVLNETLDGIQALALPSPDVSDAALARIQARSLMEQARLLTDLGNDPESFLKALQMLDRVSEMADIRKSMKAEALFLQAGINSRIGRAGQVALAFEKVIEDAPDTLWADQSVEQMIDTTLSDPALTTEAARIEALSRLARTYRTALPKLAMGAFNRMGDISFARGDWRQAKTWYRQVLTGFPQTGARTATQTAAARLALAEVLYQEELFREALDLYQTEMELRPDEERLYRLARAAYIQKSLAAADFLFQLGEVPGAQSIYAELIREDPTLVQAHRGTIKCAAAKKEMGPTLALYRGRMEMAPDDPVTLYTTGLCLTYLEGKDHLEEARSLIRKAIDRKGQVEYFHQTLGYIFETMETVHHQPGYLEKALESYQKAYFLNRPEQDPRNAADLALNLGNIHFLLGQYGKALERYLERLDAKTPFDHPDTEILFYRRLGAAAFQVRDPQRPITAFQKAIALIDKRIDPRRPSEVLGKMNDAIRDRNLTQALKRPETAKAAEALARRQAAINQRLFEATTRPFGPPPDPRWEVYRDALESIIKDQEAIIRDIAPLIQEKREETTQTLGYMLLRAREALGFPKAMVRLKAEMLDRLGLAFQEAGQWPEARATFEEAFLLNKALGQVQNLAANQRSVAYSEYMAAGTLTGEARIEMLRQAARDFRQVEALLKEHGTTTKEAKKASTARPGQALLNLSLDLSLNATDASKAMYGFNAAQERRLGQAFISRIETELGEISAAEDAVVQQLALYPPGKPIADGDLYGVSLLTHRGGQLSYALQRPKEAFRRFYRSALLSLRLKNPVSAALNVENMAVALARMPAPDPQAAQCQTDLMILDRQTTRLLKTFSEVLDPLVAPAYHNILGVFILADAQERGKDSPEDAARRVNALAEAGSHFSEGLAWLDRLKGPKGRKALGLEAALHLNMARVAGGLEENHKQKAHLERALQVSQKGVLPQYEWRALAGLGDLASALAALDGVSLFESGCGPGEIVGRFSPMVSDLIRQGKSEAAFNLLERISETERFHRLRPLILGPLTDPEKSWLERVLPRLMTITRLETDLKTAPKEEQPHLRARIDQELTLIREAMGDRGERVPQPVRLARSEALQQQVMILLGLALKARQMAEAAVDQGPGPGAEALNKEYQDAITSYRKVWKEIRARAAREGFPGLAAMFGPDPVEAIDLMEGLPAGWTCVRLFKGADQGTPGKAFIVTPDDITIQKSGVNGTIPETKEGKSVIVYEDPSALPVSLNRPLALSATHLVRSIQNQKPFRRRIVALASESALPPPFEVTSLTAGATESEIFHALPGAQGLLLGGPLFSANPVPTRPGEVPSPYLAMGLDKGRAFPLARLSGQIPDVSLALLPAASIADAYPLGHLFAILGVPTLLIPGHPQARSKVVERFFPAYADAPVYDALLAAEKQAGDQQAWVSLGYWGMTEEEALSLAEKRFKQYVADGVQSFKGKDPLTAMVRFDKALNVARQTKGLNRYVPQLTTYARESAYGAGRYREAEQYAKALADMLAREKPDSREHAEALIRLGLVQARMEKYDQAVPVLEEGAEIMANLELGAPQVEALNDLGVVLENATDYDRALARFQSAASLSKAMNKEELLAQQHMRMGRITDLRLSQYAKAKEHYMAAHGLYEGLGQKQPMAQALLDIGRCDRLLGNFVDASDQYQKAMVLLDTGEKDQRLRANIMMEMANNDWFQARYQDAFKREREVLGQARENRWDLEQVNALNTSGLIWWTLGNHDRALRDLEDALALAKSLKARQDEVATTLNNMGLVYRDQEAYPKALKALDEALRIDTKIRSRWAMAYDFKNQAITYLRMGKPEAALPLFEKALATAQEIGNRINQAKILAAYGDALAQLDRMPEADRVYSQALDLSRAMALRETEWRALFGLARLRLKKKERETARDLLSQAVDVIEKMRADIKLDQLRDGFIANKMDVYETLVGLLVDMGKDSEAFQVAERSRARNLIDLLGNQRLSLHGAVDQELYDREKALKARISEYEALLAQSREDTERAVYGRAFQRARDEHRDLMLEIQMKNPQLASILSVQPLTLPEVQELLEPGVAILAYYVVPDEILCWRITRDGADLFRTPIGRKALRETILDYRRVLQNLEPPEAVSRQLHTWLLSRPGLEGVKAVGIVPHDVLHHLSFATLFDGNAYLVDRFPLFSLPSASVLRYTLKRRAEEKNAKVLAVGNPDLENPSLDLPFAEREVGAIGWNFPDITVLTRKQATEGWVVRNISNFGIIHLASHGAFDPINPLFSAVKLAKDDPYDGDLKASEIFGLDIRAGLVVLSACQTGLGKVSSGDDVIGMNRAFLYAGTHAVISSLWRVSDITTAILVKQFYREYKTEHTARSLRDAMRHVKIRYPHPGYWGAFVLVGDYQ